MKRIYYQTSIDITWEEDHCVPFDEFSPPPSNLSICSSSNLSKSLTQTGLPLRLISSGVCGPLFKPRSPKSSLDTW